MNIININAKDQAQADKAIDLLAEAFGYQEVEGEEAISKYEYVNDRFLTHVNEYLEEGNNRQLLKQARDNQPENAKIKVERPARGKK